MDAAKKKFLSEHLGSAEADWIEEQLSTLEKTLHEHGIQWKEVLEEPQRADDGDVVTALKQSRHPAAKYLLDLTKGATR